MCMCRHTALWRTCVAPWRGQCFRTLAHTSWLSFQPRWPQTTSGRVAFLHPLPVPRPCADTRAGVEHQVTSADVACSCPCGYLDSQPICVVWRKYLSEAARRAARGLVCRGDCCSPRQQRRYQTGMAIYGLANSTDNSCNRVACQ